MNFIHSIKLRLTLWYLSVFTLLIILLGSGVYLTLSRDLHGNMDVKLKNRAAQLAGFRDIISILAGGTFEEEFGELVSFHYYGQGGLRHVTPKGQAPPPVDRALIEKILLVRPEMIIYISCYPAALARDIGLLKEDYKVKKILLYDMFPQTVHCEAVVELVRKG